MSAKCDSRAQARQTPLTPRERALVEELLSKKWVLVENHRVGMAGLGWSYFLDLVERLESLGFSVVEKRTTNDYVRLLFPGEHE